MATDELESLSVRLGTTWKSLARKLLVSVVEIEAFDEANVRLRDKAYRMLMRWKAREGSHATYQVLHYALSHELVGRRDFARNSHLSQGGRMTMMPMSVNRSV